jgi:hypothetical protein
VPLSTPPDEPSVVDGKAVDHQGVEVARPWPQPHVFGTSPRIARRGSGRLEGRAKSMLRREPQHDLDRVELEEGMVRWGVGRRPRRPMSSENRIRSGARATASASCADHRGPLTLRQG